MSTKRVDTLAVLIPQAVALRAGGTKWDEIARKLSVGVSTLHRWRKRPEWAAAEAALAAKSQRIEQRIEQDTAALMEESRRTVAQAYSLALGKIVEVLGRPPRNDDTRKVRSVKKGKGAATVTSELLARPPVDEAASMAKSLGAQGLRQLADMAIKGPFVPDTVTGGLVSPADAVGQFEAVVKAAKVVEHEIDLEANGTDG